MPWLARFTLTFFFLVSGLVEAEAWKDTGKEGRWLVRRKRDVAAEQDKDGDDSLHSLLASSSETSPEGEVVPKEKYTELEDKIPGLKDGMFKSPADGEWKKVKSISKVPNKKYNKLEGVNRDIQESAETKTEFGETDKMRKVKGMKKLKSVKKIKNIIDIDDDLALKMKKEVEEGNRPKPAGESGEKVVSGGEAERHQGEGWWRGRPSKD